MSASAKSIDLHPVKRESFHLPEKLNIDPKGFHRPVDEFRVADGALYMARPADHPTFHYLESWLVPHCDVRVSRFHFVPGHKPTQLLYIDVAVVDDSDPQCWRTQDLYVDVVTHSTGRLDVLDFDELGAALQANFLDANLASRALISTQTVLDGLRRCGGVAAWLREQGVRLSWRDGFHTT